jgi:hypothetical protein
MRKTSAIPLKLCVPLKPKISMALPSLLHTDRRAPPLPIRPRRSLHPAAGDPYAARFVVRFFAAAAFFMAGLGRFAGFLAVVFLGIWRPSCCITSSPVMSHINTGLSACQPKSKRTVDIVDLPVHNQVVHNVCLAS